MVAAKLGKALVKMPDTGPDGFEGLAATLLQLVLGETFVLARTGDQPSGDAHNLDRDVCIQAKRYAPGTALNAKNIEGEFDADLRSLPQTDVFILAVTRNTAQLDDTLDAMRQKSGVDIVVLDLDGDESDLVVLCIEFWDKLQSFEALHCLNAELECEVKAIREGDAHQQQYARLKAEIQSCTQTFSTTRVSAQAYLAKRFFEHGTVQSSRIELKKAVSRPSTEAQVWQWWQNSKASVVLLKGEEGMGKTWLAAQCANRIAKDGNALVFWLDSLIWQNCHSIEALLREALLRLHVGEREKLDRLVRKTRTRWSGKTVIVLDGANERGSIEAAQKILDDLITKEEGQIRLIVTTRPLFNSPRYEPSFWERWPEVLVERFSEPEFEEAISKISPPLRLEEIPDTLISYAKIPRYFHTCVRLRDKLRSFANISLPLVLWTDLVDKISGAEPLLRDTLGITTETDATEILIKLATNSPVGGQGLAQDLLNKCFGGNYSTIRHYLTELRITERTGVFEATLSHSHTILGRALFLQQILTRLPNSHIREMADQLIRELEPLAGEDGAAEALFVALHLGALGQASSITSGQRRAALLYAWVFCHNSAVTDERLGFWCEHDVMAYVHFTEAFFEDLYAGDSQLSVIKPLARLWKCGGDQVGVLAERMKRWLLLTWFDEMPANQPAFVHEGHHLPLANSPEQVRLASVALSMLSLRPNREFLRELALCRATEQLSWRYYKQPRGGELHKHHFKSLGKNIGILMRWGFTEAVLADLERLASDNLLDNVVLEGTQSLARALLQVQLPANLARPPFQGPTFYFGTPAVELIRNRKRLFPQERGELYLSHRDFAHLAIRNDLPEILHEDIQLITDGVEKICHEQLKAEAPAQEMRDRELRQWWPWYAKFKPRESAELAGRLCLNALDHDNPCVTLFVFQGMLVSHDENAWTEWLQKCSHKWHNAPSSYHTLDYAAVQACEMSLLSMPSDRAGQWLLDAALSASSRSALFHAPIYDMLPFCAAQGTWRSAAEKCLENGDAEFGPNDGPPSELEYWCYLASREGKHNPALFAWAWLRIQECKTPDERNFSLLRLWMRSAPAGHLESIISDPLNHNLINDTALRAWLTGTQLSFDAHKVQGAYEELMEKCPISLTGRIFAAATRFDKPVLFQPSPAIFRISPHSEVEVLNRQARIHRKHH